MMMRCFLVLGVLCLASAIKTTPSGAYTIIQSQINELNQETQNNAKLLSSVKNTLKQATQELRESKLLSSMNRGKNERRSPRQNRQDRLSAADKQRLAHIQTMMAKINKYENELKNTGTPVAAQNTPIAPVASSNPSTVSVDPELNALSELDNNLKMTQKAMDKESVQNESELSEAQLKEELERYTNKLAKIDQFAVLKMRSRPRRPRTLLEKNLDRRKNFIKRREAELLDALHKKEMELHSVAPTFQGNMKDALLMIFKNEDKNRIPPEAMLAKKHATTKVANNKVAIKKVDDKKASTKPAKKE